MDPRTAAARLTHRERAALIRELLELADGWKTSHPPLQDFWGAVADMLAEVDHHARVRDAAEPGSQRLRPARPARR